MHALALVLTLAAAGLGFLGGALVGAAATTERWYEMPPASLCHTQESSGGVGVLLYSQIN